MSLKSSVPISTVALMVGALAPSIAAQAPAPPDSGVHRLAPVSISADSNQERGIFERLSERAKLTHLTRENRYLERKLAHYDKVIVRLEGRLDSLKAGRALREQGIALLDSAVAAARAKRARLETKVRVSELSGGQSPAAP